MASPGNDSMFMSFALLVNRLTFGGVVAAQAIMYMRAGEGGTYGHEVFYRDVYKPLDPGYLPVKVSMYYAYALPYVALLMAVFILVGIYARAAALAMLLILLTVLFAVFREHGMPSSTWNAGVYLVVLAGLALLLSATGPGRFSLDKLAGGGGKKAPKAEGKDKG